MNYLDSPQQAFEHALELCNKNDFGASVPFFLHAIREAARESPEFNKYLSHYGLALMYIGNRDEGINKCLIAAQSELNNPMVFYNLARAAIIVNRRKLAINAISQGMSVDPNSEELNNLRSRLGIRRQPILKFLSRNNLLNIFIGKLTYKHV